MTWCDRPGHCTSMLAVCRRLDLDGASVEGSLPIYRERCSLGGQLIAVKYLDGVANLRPWIESMTAWSVTKVIANHSASYVYHMQISPLKENKSADIWIFKVILPSFGVTLILILCFCFGGWFRILISFKYPFPTSHKTQHNSIVNTDG